MISANAARTLLMLIEGIQAGTEVYARLHELLARASADGRDITDAELQSLFDASTAAENAWRKA